MNMSNYNNDGTNLNPSNLRGPDDNSAPIFSHVDKNRSGQYIGPVHGYGTVAGSHLDHAIGGGAVLRNGSKVSVADYSEAKPSDIIVIDGMEITMEIARSMGLLKEYSGKGQPKAAVEEKPWRDDREDGEQESIAEEAFDLAHSQLALETGELSKGITLIIADGLSSTGEVD
ncbi:hypothetical protein JZU51_00085, partial [bacterium]|nr:hypothetical protein [bacterium]